MNDISITYSDATFTIEIVIPGDAVKSSWGIAAEGEQMRYLYPAGRILFALIFITAAPRHFTHEGIQHAADLGVPVASLLVPLSGLMAIAGGLSVALGYKARWGAWLLVAFLLPVTVMMHSFWRLQDSAQIHIQQAMFAKNVSMLGAALLLTQFDGGPVSLDRPERK